MKERNDKMKKALAISVAAMVIMSSSLAYAKSDNSNRASRKRIEKAEQQLERGVQRLEKENQKVEKAEERVARLSDLKEALKAKYSNEELDKVNRATEELKKEDKGLKVLPFNNVVSKNKSYKFDTPPVIKGGRTLIPVRAITEGLGAEVKWNAETKEVTITKGDITIVITIDNNVVLVNGVEVAIDAKAELLTSRTYVPLRFIAEALGLKVTWDEETEIIEIDEDEEDESLDENEDENEDEDEAEDLEETEEESEATDESDANEEETTQE